MIKKMLLIENRLTEFYIYCGYILDIFKEQLIAVAICIHNT